MSDTPPADTGTNRDRGTDRNVLNTDMMQWVSALVAIVGLWIIASPFVYEAADAAFWNNTLVGAGIFLLAGYNFYLLSNDRLANVGAASLAVLLGLWIAVSPSLIEMGSGALSSSTVVSGIAVAIVSAYNAYANNKADTPERAGARA